MTSLGLTAPTFWMAITFGRLAASERQAPIQRPVHGREEQIALYGGSQRWSCGKVVAALLDPQLSDFFALADEFVHDRADRTFGY